MEDTVSNRKTEKNTTNLVRHFSRSQLNQINRLYGKSNLCLSTSTETSDPHLEVEDAHILGMHMTFHSADVRDLTQKLLFALDSLDTNEFDNTCIFTIYQEQDLETEFELLDDYWVESTPMDYKNGDIFYSKYKKIKEK